MAVIVSNPKEYFINFNGKKYRIPTGINVNEVNTSVRRWVSNESVIIKPEVGQRAYIVIDGKVEKCTIIGSFVKWVWSAGSRCYRSKNYLCLYFESDGHMHVYEYNTYKSRLMLFDSLENYVHFLEDGGCDDNLQKYTIEFEQLNISRLISLTYDKYEFGYDCYDAHYLKRYYAYNGRIEEGEIQIQCIKYDSEGFKMYCEIPENNFIHKKDLINFMVNGIKKQFEDEESTYEVEVKHKVRVTAKSPEEALEKARAMYDQK